MSEQERADMESIGIVHRGKRYPRAQVHFVPEGEYRKLTAMAAEYPALKKKEAILEERIERERVIRENEKQIRAARGIARGCAGVIFLVAAVQGMMNPLFAGAMMLGCVAWGAGAYIRGVR